MESCEIALLSPRSPLHPNLESNLEVELKFSALLLAPLFFPMACHKRATTDGKNNMIVLVSPYGRK